MAENTETEQQTQSHTWPKDVVIVHHLTRGPYAPSMSPYAIKLETFLRMANISYQYDFLEPLSSKGKVPWITYNGVDVADSQLSIEYLKKMFNASVDNGYSQAELGIARAFQRMVDEDLYWHLIISRWCRHTEAKFMGMAFNHAPFIEDFLPRAKLQAYNQGLARHTDDELWVLYKQDMDALSSFIGTKKFLLGDKSCEADCAVFGQLCEFLLHLPGTPQEKYMKEETPNLVNYCETMKEAFWPDWDDCITHGGKVEATK